MYPLLDLRLYYFIKLVMCVQESTKRDGDKTNKTSPDFASALNCIVIIVLFYCGYVNKGACS